MAIDVLCSPSYNNNQGINQTPYSCVTSPAFPCLQLIHPPVRTFTAALPDTTFSAPACYPPRSVLLQSGRFTSLLSPPSKRVFNGFPYKRCSSSAMGSAAAVSERERERHPAPEETKEVSGTKFWNLGSCENETLDDKLGEFTQGMQWQSGLQGLAAATMN